MARSMRGCETSGTEGIQGSGMPLSDELDLYLRARFTLIWLVTREEERALYTIRAVSIRARRSCFTWDIADGFQRLVGEGPTPEASDPLTALDRIAHDESGALYVLKDYHDFWKDPRIKRKLRSVAQGLKYTKSSIVVLSPGGTLPDELRDEATRVDLPLPTARDLGRVLDGLVRAVEVDVQLTPLGREKLVQAALGLTEAQARRVYAKAIVRDGRLDDRDIDLVTAEKKLVIRESQALEFYPASETPDDVGGLGVLKRWLRLRERAFGQAAREYGLPAPKGIALVGIPGTGKSLTAKMIGGLWHMPLLRLDVGALFGSLVGESEERTRRALRLAETIAPCIVWIDEMEKALAHGGNDSGTSTRVFGTILTWMQEKTAPCFVVATANDISRLPPELLRKGRFDEVFFLDLPTAEERREILAVHLRKRGRLPRDFDLHLLTEASEGYVGAEIEQAIIEAMTVAFYEEREPTSDDIAAALARTVPMLVSQRETVGALRAWLREGRAQSASFQQTQEAEQQFVSLPLEVRR